MELFQMYCMVGVMTGAMLGWHAGRPLAIAAAIGGAILGAPIGLGYSWLHGRFVLWLAGANRPPVAERPQAGTWRSRNAARIYDFLYRLPCWIVDCLLVEWPTIIGLVVAVLITPCILTLLVLLPFGPVKTSKPGEMTDLDALALMAAGAVGSHLMFWASQKIRIGVQIRRAPPPSSP
jgi:hypothetical protein